MSGISVRRSLSVDTGPLGDTCPPVWTGGLLGPTHTVILGLPFAFLRGFIRFSGSFFLFGLFFGLIPLHLPVVSSGPKDGTTAGGIVVTGSQPLSPLSHSGPIWFTWFSALGDGCHPRTSIYHHPVDSLHSLLWWIFLVFCILQFFSFLIYILILVAC